ncbi:MAG TPA: DUF4376 domain-containing protein [Candidatus Desulfovibrio gallistercoris]|nr:DUF4376 domain-containing protein [Candidatus Desulfovibrio gallistercoris]
MFNIPRFYRLEDGRIWQVDCAAFVSADAPQVKAYLAAGHAFGVAPDESGALSRDGLRQTLSFYGLPLGELMTLEDARATALARLNVAFTAAEASGKVTSAAGFVIDATERSNRDIEGLITSLEATGTQDTNFCAADNSFHTVTLDQLRTMRLEVIAHGQALYARKWELRTAIETAQSVEAVQAVDINFDGGGA